MTQQGVQQMSDNQKVQQEEVAPTEAQQAHDKAEMQVSTPELVRSTAAHRDLREIDLDAWVTQYRPIEDDLHQPRLYETYGSDLAEVRKAEPTKVWTLVEYEGTDMICSGFHLVNRLGYYITEEPFRDHQDLAVIFSTQQEMSQPSDLTDSSKQTNHEKEKIREAPVQSETTTESTSHSPEELHEMRSAQEQAGIACIIALVGYTAAKQAQPLYETVVSVYDNRKEAFQQLLAEVGQLAPSHTFYTSQPRELLSQKGETEDPEQSHAQQQKQDITSEDIGSAAEQRDPRIQPHAEEQETTEQPQSLAEGPRNLNTPGSEPGNNHKRTNHMSAWRPHQNFIEGELDNTRPGHVRGWMSFVGIKEPVTFDLTGDCHRDIRGAKIRLKNDSPVGEAEEMKEYMEGFGTHQTGRVGDITAGLPPQDYSPTPYIEWYSDRNGRVVLELDPTQVQVIGTPLAWENEKPISREQQARNMGQFLAKLSAELGGVPAFVVGQPPAQPEKTNTSESDSARRTNEKRTAEKPEAADPHTVSGNERSEPMAENQSEKNGPLYDLRSGGRVQGSIWDREGPNGETRYTVSVSRSYKDKEGNWQRVSSFDLEDLPHLKVVLAKAEQILKEELGQNITNDVKVTRKEEAKQGHKQSL
jgi:hypothetical protein